MCSQAANSPNVVSGRPSVPLGTSGRAKPQSAIAISERAKTRLDGGEIRARVTPRRIICGSRTLHDAGHSPYAVCPCVCGMTRGVLGGSVPLTQFARPPHRQRGSRRSDADMMELREPPCCRKRGGAKPEPVSMGIILNFPNRALQGGFTLRQIVGQQS